MGLTIVLDAGLSEYYCSSTNSYGFKVQIHSPNEVPRIANYGILIPRYIQLNFVRSHPQNINDDFDNF